MSWPLSFSALRVSRSWASTRYSGQSWCARRWESRLPGQARDAQRNPPLAFAFDIDGVLVRGEEAIPEAKRALKVLQGDNSLGIKIPYILITNGGGTSERIRCRNLTERLGTEIKLSQFMQAHTVLQSVVDQYTNSPVLVLGGKPGAVPAVAAEYGFRNVYTTLDILAWNQSIWPFHELDPTEHAFVKSRRPFDPSTRIAAVFVFHDPRNWALDTQIVVDILRWGGYVLPEHARPPISNTEKDSDVQLIFCNPDLLWGSSFPVPRIGQGGFRVAFQAVYKALTGEEYPYTQFGKPTQATYRFAEELLKGQLNELNEKEGIEPDKDHMPEVYMVGDNPDSDIAGANATGWSSILVETGVYDPARGPPTHEPTHIAKDVERAVKWAVDREFAKL